MQGNQLTMRFAPILFLVATATASLSPDALLSILSGEFEDDDEDLNDFNDFKHCLNPGPGSEL